MSDVSIEFGQHLLHECFPISCGFNNQKNKSVCCTENRNAALDSLARHPVSLLLGRTRVNPNNLREQWSRCNLSHCGLVVASGASCCICWFPSTFLTV